MLKTKMEKIPHANLFNSTILPAKFYTNETWSTTMKKRTETGYSTDGSGNNYAENIIA